MRFSSAYARTANTIKKYEQQGVEKGIEKGVLKGKLEIARNMLSGNVEPETIRKFTGLSLKEIQSLKSSF